MEFRKKLLVVTVIAAAMMELIDTSIVNVALSHICGNLGATLEDTSWIISAYAIANVIIIPMTSFLSQQFGRKKYYIGSVLLFTFFSFMCGQASSIWSLVAFRFVQGIGGGALLSVSQAILFENFAKEKQGVASAIFGVSVFTGPAIGPVLGGYITEGFSWPWIFYVNIPIGLLVALFCSSLLQQQPVSHTVRKIDWTGIVLLCVGISALQIVLERGQTENWYESHLITWLTAIAAVGLCMFILWEIKVSNPVVDVRVLKSKSLSIAAFMTFISGLGLYASVLLTPVFAQMLLGYTASQAGLLLLPGSLIAIVCLAIAARLLQKGLSPLILIAAGFCLFVVFSWKMSQLNLDASSTLISNILILRAAGIALMTVPLTTLALSSLSAKDIPQGAALNNMMRQLGGSFGIAVVNTFLITRSAQHRSDLITNVTIANPVFTERLNGLTDYFLKKGFTAGDAAAKALGAIDLTVSRQASLLSFIDCYMLLGTIFLFSMVALVIAAFNSNKKISSSNVGHQ